MAGTAPRTTPTEQRETALDTLLAQPLGTDAAVRVALLNSPRLDDAMATLALSDADRVQASSLPNPVFAFERLVEGPGLEIDRALRFNVLGIVTLPWRARWAGQQHEVGRLRAAQSVLELAADTRRAWVRAVAAQQSVAYLRDAHEAADAGAELAQRMARAGNWNALQQSRELLMRAEAQAQLARAEQAATSTREQLTRLLGLTGARATYTLPDRLPDLPAAPPEAGDLEARALRDRLDVRAAQAQSAYLADTLGLTRVTGVVSALEVDGVNNTTWSGPGERRQSQRGWGLDVPIPLFDWGQARNARAQALYMQSAARVRETAVLAASESREAARAQRTAYDLARRYRDEVVPLRRQTNEEMLLRYNGMLASVWALLGEARATALAVSAGIDAQRDFWLADTDLQLALTGSSPGGRAALQAPNTTAAAGAATEGAH